MLIRADEFVELELEMVRRKKQKIEDLRVRAWNSDIDPEVFYTEDIEKIAEDSVNYETGLEIAENLKTLYTGVGREVAKNNNQEMIKNLQNQKRNTEMELKLQLRKLLDL